MCFKHIQYKPAVVIFLLLFCLTLNAHASKITVQSGWLHTPSSAYGDSVETNVRYQQPLVGDFDLALEGGYHGSTKHTIYGSISGYGALGEAIYTLPVTWAVKPYILAGAGYYWWDWHRSQDMADRGIQIETKGAFAEKLAVGADYPINDHWGLNIEWSYFHSDVPKNSFYESDGSFANVAGNDNRSGKVTIGQEETNLLIGLVYKW